MLALLAGGGVGSLAGCERQRQGQSPDTSSTATGRPTETPTDTPSGPVWKPRNQPTSLQPSEVVGSAHVDGAYQFTSEDFLNEGAKRLTQLGTDVIKIWFHRMSDKYPYNSDWQNEYDSLVDVAQTEHVREVFERGFSTYVLMAHAYTSGARGVPFRDGMTDSEMTDVRDRFASLTRHLLRTYDGTGNTFVLQHWEGDNLVQADSKQPLPEDTADHVRRWLTARQDGVTRARDRVESDVTVLHAAEVNYVLDAKNAGTPRLINDVIPETEVDMVSYSAWELGGQLGGEGWAPGHNGREQYGEAEPVITETLDYLESQAPEPDEYTAGSLTDRQSNVYLGEFGAPLQDDGPETAMRKVRPVLEHSLDWGVRFAIYWQLYGNETTVDGDVTENDDVRGFYLVRPDGTTAPTWAYLSRVLARNESY